MTDPVIITSAEQLEQLITEHDSVFSRSSVNVVTPVGRAAARTVEQIRSALPNWLDQHRVVYSLDNRRIELGNRAFVFHRNSRPQRIEQLAATERSTSASIADYERALANTRTELETLRRQVDNPIAGTSFEELGAFLAEWPEFVSLSIGPGMARNSGDALGNGQIAITLLPVLFDGTRVHENSTVERPAFASTTMITFILSEEGGVTMGRGTEHPHTRSGGDMCQGNMQRVLQSLIRQNSLLSALSVLRDYRLAHNPGDYLNHGFSTRGWAWWQTVAQQFREMPTPADRIARIGYDPYYNWDGVSIQSGLANAPDHPVLPITEFFGGNTLDHINHIAQVMTYISTDHVNTLAAELTSTEQTQTCPTCGRPGTGCSCHGVNCGECGRSAARCRCPAIEGFRPRPTTWYRMEGSSGQSRVTYMWVTQNDGFTCTGRRSAGTCGSLAMLRNLTMGNFWCRQHIPPAIWADLMRQEEEWRTTGVQPNTTTAVDRFIPRILVSEGSGDWAVVRSGGGHICEVGQIERYAARGACGAPAIAQLRTGALRTALLGVSLLAPTFFCEAHHPVTLAGLRQLVTDGALTPMQFEQTVDSPYNAATLVIRGEATTPTGDAVTDIRHSHEHSHRHPDTGLMFLHRHFHEHGAGSNSTQHRADHIAYRYSTTTRRRTPEQHLELRRA